MVDEVLYPRIVRIAGGRRAIFPARVLAQEIARPIRNVEGRIREDVVGLEVRVQVARKTVRRLFAQICLNTTNGEVLYAPVAMLSGWIPVQIPKDRASIPHGPRRSVLTGQTCRPTRRQRHRRGPRTARSSRP
jgi:hypothetical protein